MREEGRKRLAKFQLHKTKAKYVENMMVLFFAERKHTFSLTFSKDDGETTEKQTKKTSVWG